MIIEGKQYEIKLNSKTYHCALDVTMDYIGGKWKTVVLWYLIKGKKRFGELNKLIPDITEKMLSIQLKQLEEMGLVAREAFAEVPLRVEYSLTTEGKSLIPVLEEIARWGRNYAARKGKVLEVKPERAKK